MQRDGSVVWRLWAPKADRVELVLIDGERRSSHAMTKQERGFFAFAHDSVENGQRYLYRLNDAAEYPDPASRWQPSERSLFLSRRFPSPRNCLFSCSAAATVSAFCLRLARWPTRVTGRGSKCRHAAAHAYHRRFERSTIVECVKTRLNRAKTEGKVLDRPRVTAAVEAQVVTLRKQGLGVRAIAREHEDV